MEDPYPTGKYPDQKVWVWVLFSSLKNTKKSPVESGQACGHHLLLVTRCRWPRNQTGEVILGRNLTADLDQDEVRGTFVRIAHPKTLLRLFFASRGYLKFPRLFLETLQEYPLKQA